MTEKTQHIEHHATICSAIEADPALAAARRDRAAARAARERPTRCKWAGSPSGSGKRGSCRRDGTRHCAPELRRFAREAADNVACSM